MALIQPLQRPARLMSISLAVSILLLWFAYLRDLSPACSFPVILRNVSSSDGDSDSASLPPPIIPAVDGSSRQRPLAPGQSKIAKVTVATNKLDSPLIDRALRTHQVHNEMHGYLHYVGENQVVSSLIENDPKRRPKGAWTKPALMMSIIVAELQKPDDERLEWLFWFDADTIVVNPMTPLELFLPEDSDPTLRAINLLISSNWDGLNSGAFALRVHPWSVSLLSAVLGYPIYKAANLKTDRFRDQSAFQWLLTHEDSPILASTPLKGKEFWAEVPIRWFNSLPVNNAFEKDRSWLFAKNMTDNTFDKGTQVVYNDGKDGRVQRWKVMRGDMIVHFAGTNRVRDSWMTPWLDRADALLPEWANTSTQYALRDEVQAYWAGQSKMLADSKAAVKIITVTGSPQTETTTTTAPIVLAKEKVATTGPAQGAEQLMKFGGGVQVVNDGSPVTLTAVVAAAAAQSSAGEELLIDTRPAPNLPVR